MSSGRTSTDTIISSSTTPSATPSTLSSSFSASVTTSERPSSSSDVPPRPSFSAPPTTTFAPPTSTSVATPIASSTRISSSASVHSSAITAASPSTPISVLPSSSSSSTSRFAPVAPPSSSAPTSSLLPAHASSHVSTGAAVGGSIGGVAVISIAVFGILYFRRRYRPRDPEESDHRSIYHYRKHSESPVPFNHPSSRRNSNRPTTGSEPSSPSSLKFDINDLRYPHSTASAIPPSPPQTATNTSASRMTSPRSTPVAPYNLRLHTLDDDEARLVRHFHKPTTPTTQFGGEKALAGRGGLADRDKSEFWWHRNHTMQHAEPPPEYDSKM